jgi:hypothetical protein
MIPTNVVEKDKTRCKFNNFFLNVPFMRKYKKYSKGGLASNDNTVHAHFILGT